MTRKFTFALSIILSLPGYAALPQAGSGESDGYKLVWQDLFDAETLNDLRWNIEVNGDGGGNSELQYYTDRPENVRLGDDGEGNHCLILTARRENYKNKNFTSGRVNSMHLVTFTHGKIEASIKLPVTANGLWPAFWMMGNDYSSVGWPRCGETDILEMGHSDGIRNGTSDRYFNGACHWGEKWPNASYAKSSTKGYSLQDGEYHLYTLIWDENKFRMYVDLDRYPNQVPYYEMGITADNPGEPNSPGNYFHKENFILFNLAIGGNFPGIHNASGITALNEENGQEASMYVNYVKVYQREEVPGTTLFSAVESDPLDGGSGVEYAVSDSEGVMKVFNIGGVPVRIPEAAEDPETLDLEPGIYIIKQGRTTQKFIKR